MKIKEICVGLAGLSVKISYRSDFCKNMCKNYIIEDSGKYDITVPAVTDSEIKIEQNAQQNITPAVAEFACIYRKIAEQLPHFSRVVFHGAAITYKEKGLLFTAPSGTGKSTHIRLWRETLGSDVKIINGDKPILHIENGLITAYGTPWAGKEKWQKNRKAQLKAICILARGSENKIKKLCPQECTAYLMNQIYLPQEAAAASSTLKILSDMVENTPVYKLYCDISEQAVNLSFKTLIGE